MELQHNAGFIRPKPFGTRLFNRNRDNDAYLALKLGGAGAMWGKRTKLFGWAPVLSVALLVGIAPRSFAQDQGIVPAGEYREGVVVGDWKLYPKIFVGAVGDTVEVERIRSVGLGDQLILREPRCHHAAAGCG